MHSLLLLTPPAVGMLLLPPLCLCVQVIRYLRYITSATAIIIAADDNIAAAMLEYDLPLASDQAHVATKIESCTDDNSNHDGHNSDNRNVRESL